MSLLDLFRGRAITIPPLDGAFRPNAALEEAEVAAYVAAPDDLAAVEGQVFCAVGDTVQSLGPAGVTTLIARFSARVSCLAARPGGGFAVGLEDGRLMLWAGGKIRELARPEGLRCPTAIVFSDPTQMLVTHGSAHLPPSAWARAIMKDDRSGALWQVSLDGEGRRLAGDLAFPWGVAARGDGGVVVSEAARHRLVAVASGRVTPLLAGLPGYPARLIAAADGGAWLALAAPRNRLVEFVLNEKSYRQAMLADVDPRFWIAPALSSGRSFLEPLQCGAVRSMGVHKPWAPSRSYGLIARLDAQWQPVASFHSRSDGARHGVTGLAELGGRLFAAAQGGDMVVVL